MAVENRVMLEPYMTFMRATAPGVVLDRREVAQNPVLRGQRVLARQLHAHAVSA